MNEKRTEPAFLRIARELIEDIRAGRLRSGQRIPSSRRLATDEGVHRNTVLAAYSELEAQGWIEAVQGRGTFVTDDLPKRISAPGSQPQTSSYRLNPAPEHIGQLPSRGALAIGSGTPDTRLIPAMELSRALRRALRRAPQLLDYGSPFGTLRLRQAVADMLRNNRRIVADEDRVLITRGSQMGIYLLGQALLRHGDRVAVEATGYRPAWQALRMSGATLAPVATDSEGMNIAALEKLHERCPVRAVYLTPHHQFPTLVTLSASRRLALLAFARRHRVAVLEDDYDHEFHYEGRPVPPLASADTSGNVIYIGTLSKVLAPGLRIGYLVAPKELVENLAAIRSHIDGQGDAVSETAIAEWIEEGDLERHTRRVRKIYLQRRGTLIEGLRRRLSDCIDFDVPNGGMALWLRCRKDIDAKLWAAHAAAHNVQVYSASHYRFDRRNRPFLRLGFARLDSSELERAVDILAHSRPTKT